MPLTNEELLVKFKELSKNIQAMKDELTNLNCDAHGVINEIEFQLQKQRNITQITEQREEEIQKIKNGEFTVTPFGIANDPKLVKETRPKDKTREVKQLTKEEKERLLNILKGVKNSP